MTRFFIYLLNLLFLVTLVFIYSCKDDESDNQLDYPYALEYQGLKFNSTEWFEITSNGYSPTAEPSGFGDLDSEMKIGMETAFEDLLLQKLEFLNDSTVNMHFSDGNTLIVLESKYIKSANKTLISVSVPPNTIELGFLEGDDPNSLELGMLGSLYVFTDGNGGQQVDILHIWFSSERDLATIINDAKDSGNLNAGDLIAVSRSGFLYK